MIRLSFIRIITFVSIILLGVGCDFASISPEKQAKKFLTAVQKGDFKTIFDMTYNYQQELSRIKANNPKVLWQKLTTEYYEHKKECFDLSRNNVKTWDDVQRHLECSPGIWDPMRDIQELKDLLTPNSKWKILELRKKEGIPEMPWLGGDVYEVYVLLKSKEETILCLDFDLKTGLYTGSRIVK